MPRRAAAPAGKPARPRSVSGLAMFCLALACLSLGGWAGSQMQAYAYGPVESARPDPAAMREFDPQSGFRF